MIYEIKPLDNFFFRTPAPFEAGGETTVIQSEFPPLPTSYAGAFRSLIKGEVHGSRSIKIGYNGLMIGESFYFPLPQDLYGLAQKIEDTWQVSPKCLAPSPLSNFPFPYMLRIQNSPKEKAQPLLYLEESDLQRYLQGDNQVLNAIDIHTKLIKERKLSIEIDSASGVSKNQHLYEISCVRPKLNSEIKLAVEVKGELVKESGVIKLGGEEKKAEFKQTSHQLKTEKFDGNGKYFKLYLATPAIFRNGWLPGWIDKEQKRGYFAYNGKRVTVKLISACVGRSIPCGGFGKTPGEQDNRYKPREMRYAVPAGSVYYFELIEGTFYDAMKLFHGKCISEYRENMGFDYQVFKRSRYCDRGFGYSFVGTIDKNQEELLHVR